MIFVTLGTQDKPFTRLLDAINKQIELGNINEEVIVQAGYTPYSSNNMKVFDYISQDEMVKYVDECSLLITHGGVGSIMGALAKDKTIIAAARLSKYGEHTNDHQIQILENFEKEGYLLYLENFDELDKLLIKAKTFKPKEYKSNTNNMIKLLEDYIEKN